LNVIFRGADVGQLLEILKRQFGRFMSSGRSRRPWAGSPLFALSYLALKDAGASDWFSGSVSR